MNRLTVNKTLILAIQLLCLVSCGETPTSQLSEQFPILRSGPHDMEFAFIPSGTFRMGSPEGEEGRFDGEALHWVRLTEDYWMQTTEVTRAQWFKVMGSYPGTSEKCSQGYVAVEENNHPMVCVSWEEIRIFIESLNSQERNSGYKYSLPTEAQWEYAARAYTETPYSVDGDLGSFAWYYSSSDMLTHPVGELKTNFFGLHDVHGNVWEFVSDWYGKYPKADLISDAIKDPKGAPSGEIRVFRGGDLSKSPRFSRAAARDGEAPRERIGITGFRLMRTKI